MNFKIGDIIRWPNGYGHWQILEFRTLIGSESLVSIKLVKTPETMFNYYPIGMTIGMTIDFSLEGAELIKTKKRVHPLTTIFK